MGKKFMAISFFCCCLLLEFIKGDPGRDLCKIVDESSGLKCSKISSYFFPSDAILSFKEDLAHFTSDIKFLQVENSNVSVLQASSFKHIPYLSHLILSKLFLLEIEPGAFEGVRRLKLVDLSFNLLQRIPVDAFKYTKVNKVTLEGNALLEMPTNGPILHADYLTSLSLKNCNIQHLPGSAFKYNRDLISLDLSQNYLKMLPQEIFSSLRHLAFLDLSHNQFRFLDVKTFQSMPFFPKLPIAVLLNDNPWVCDCRILELGMWLTKNVKTNGWSESPELCRLKKLVECLQPSKISWNSHEFRELISSCRA